MNDNEKIIDKGAILLIIVAALGYFVDAYDIIVASVARGSAIVDLGLAQINTPEHKSYAQLFEYVQSSGILLGGIIFGILGDKIGRKSIMMTGMLLAILLYRPIYKAMYQTVNIEHKIASHTRATSSIDSSNCVY